MAVFNAAAFIDDVRIHPYLYKLTDSNYKNSQMREVAWQVIGAAHGLTDKVAREKWRSLRDRYTRERRMFNSRKSSGGDSMPPPTWAYYHVLHSFLEHALEPAMNVTSEIDPSVFDSAESGELQSIIDRSDEGQPPEDSGRTGLQTPASPVCTPVVCMPTSPPSISSADSNEQPTTAKKKRKNLDAEIGKAINDMSTSFKSSVSALLSCTEAVDALQEQDDLYHFGNSLVSRMRALDAQKRRLFRFEIEKRLFELEMECV